MPATIDYSHISAKVLHFATVHFATVLDCGLPGRGFAGQKSGRLRLALRFFGSESREFPLMPREKRRFGIVAGESRTD
jgi:hypothetical protein